ncbi:WLM-domain-containing protein [Calocera cornea HHB12733]|uniref:WLM-domain-containing protein n=1 Tax=Calocera cornea HHB12733 TaxID=1353952 RepID=A0A165D897_9BASI|nr:WLM-domain-containing protein [Calocera cornea HHB12733]
MSDPISFTVSFKGASHPFTLLPSTLLSTLLNTLSELTTVPASLAKLVVKGRSLTLSSAGSQTLHEAGIRRGVKLLLVGSTEAQLEAVKGGEAARAAAEAGRAQRERVTRERRTRSVRTTARASTADAALQYRFHRLEALAHLPNPGAALALLQKLADDPAVQHVLATHGFSVGLLTELAPHEHPGLLGLNQNRGEVISLRLRTDGYDGMRLYAEVRRVLVHELTHCVWADHDDRFKALNSQLNREILEHELARARGAHTHTLSGPSSGGGYEPAQAAAGRAGEAGEAEEDLEERRQRVLEAVLRRALREEEEMEGRCGSAGRGSAEATRDG